LTVTREEVEWASSLATETVEGAALSLESVDNVEGGDRLALGVLGVRDGITDDTLEEGLEDTASLFVDHCERVSNVSCHVDMKETYWPIYA
jgi:hypothetical protein